MKKQTPATPADSNSFARWYSKNGAALAALRKERYKNDPVYRKNILNRAKAARIARQGEPNPPGYAYHMQGMADQLEVTIWTLREWRKKDWFPEPYEFKSRRWFTPVQLVLLTILREFLAARGRRLSGFDRPALEKVVSYIYANWSD